MLPTAASEYYRQQQQIVTLTTVAAGAAWRNIDVDVDAGFPAMRASLLPVLVEAQLAAAASSQVYLEHVLFETAQPDLPVGHFLPAAVTRTSGDGRTLDGLLYGAIADAKIAVGQGYSPAAALVRGERWLKMAVRTAVADASREATAIGLAARPQLTGYTRMLNLPSCNRCIILAGKWFRWNEGFQRHPRCDCRHIPATEDVAGDLTTDPYAAFAALTTEEQDAKFGRLEARAIRDGADIYRVVNIDQRGLGTAKAARVYGTPTRRTIDDIYRTAGTRTSALRMMRDEGYITGPQTPGGNILGRYHEAYTTPISRPIVIGSKRDRVLRARDAGVRDRLDRATMTAAERRVYDAYVVRERVTRGENPFTEGRPLTDEHRRFAREAMQVQLRALRGDPSNGVQPYPAGAQALARRLGLT